MKSALLPSLFALALGAAPVMAASTADTGNSAGQTPATTNTEMQQNGMASTPGMSAPTAPSQSGSPSMTQSGTGVTSTLPTDKSTARGNKL